MAIEFANENPQPIIDKLLPMMAEHFNEASPFGLMGLQFDPDTEFYFRAYFSGSMSFFTARDNGEPIGYVAYWIGQHQHCKHVRYAQMDMIFLKKEYRKTGVAFDLIKYAEKEMNDCGVKYVMAAVPEVKDFSKMLIQDGYKLMDKLYIKGV